MPARLHGRDGAGADSLMELPTPAAAAVTIVTLVVLIVRQVVGMRPDRAAPRWLTALTALLVVAFLVAMALRLSKAL